MQGKQVKLKSCPHCGNDKPFLHQYHNQETGQDDDYFMVICAKCDTDTYIPKEEAIQAWNKRLGDK